MIKSFIMRYILPKLIIRAYTKWYYKTRDWKKNDWRNWVAQEFERIKMSKWTLKNFPDLREISYEDLPAYPITEKYVEAPENYPTALQYYSTGTIDKKRIKLSKEDLKRIFLGIGRIIWTGKNEERFKNGLYMGFFGLGSGEMLKFATHLLSERGIYIEAGRWREHVDTIIRNAPYDLLILPLPYYADFILNFKKDIYNGLSYWIVGGDLFTEYLRSLLTVKSQEFKKVFYSVDYYGTSECFLLGTEIPPFITRALQYTPETAIILIRTENGEMINLFDAKPGVKGEVIVTSLFNYMIPNYPIHDIIEVEESESKFGLPVFRVLGRKGVRVDIELESIGHIRGWYSIEARVMGLVIDGAALNDLIGREFKCEHICFVEQRNAKVYLRIYTDRRISLDDFMKALREDDKINYLYHDIENNLLHIEIIYNQQLISEIKAKYYERYGPQATIPRIIIVESETS